MAHTIIIGHGIPEREKIANHASRIATPEMWKLNISPITKYHEPTSVVLWEFIVILFMQVERDATIIH